MASFLENVEERLFFGSHFDETKMIKNTKAKKRKYIFLINVPVSIVLTWMIKNKTYILLFKLLRLLRDDDEILLSNFFNGY